MKSSDSNKYNTRMSYQSVKDKIATDILTIDSEIEESNIEFDEG